MAGERRIRGAAGVAVLGLLATGLGAQRWTAAHVGHYTGAAIRTGTCFSCHFAARGGTLLDRVVRPRYRTPREIAVCGRSGLLLVTAEDSGALLAVDPAARGVVKEIPVGLRPHGVAVDRECRTAYVTDRGGDDVAVVDLERGEVRGRLPAGFGPTGLALGPGGDRLFVANGDGDDISVLELPAGSESVRLAAGRCPASLVASPDGRWILATNELARPARRPGPPVAEVTRIDATRGRVEERFPIPNAHLLGGGTFTPEGDLALVTIVRPKNLLPVLQVERGWMLTNGIAVIDLASGRVAQVLLDEVDRFFADPSHVAVTPDGRTAFVSHGGADAVSVIDLAALRRLVRETDPAGLVRLGNDLSASRRFVRARLATGANPRGLAVSPDGRSLYVAERLEDRIAVIDVESMETVARIGLGGPRHLSLRRRGERVFHSAASTLQRQFSCRSCHPDGRVDGLVYDFEPDGLGRNLVDNRSLLGLRGTAPFKWNGGNTSLYMQCGIRFARFLTRGETFPFDDLNALVAYLDSLPPPHRGSRLAAGGPTDAQRRGREIFERSATRDGRPIPERNRCATCHPEPLFTNGLREDVGTASPLDGAAAFDTPQLAGVAGTAPYLHDGRALTLEEIWTLYSPDDTHGVTSDLGKTGLNDLVEYLKTL